MKAYLVSTQGNATIHRSEMRIKMSLEDVYRYIDEKRLKDSAIAAMDVKRTHGTWAAGRSVLKLNSCKNFASYFSRLSWCVYEFDLDTGSKGKKLGTYQKFFEKLQEERAVRKEES